MVDRGHSQSLWPRKDSGKEPKIWGNPVDVMLQSDVTSLEHMPTNGFRIAHPSSTPTNSGFVHLSARLITRSETSIPVDPLLYHAVQVLRGPTRLLTKCKLSSKTPRLSKL